jgi:gamma-glutamyltranspeptidase/glutathione hydrolase
MMPTLALRSFLRNSLLVLAFVAAPAALAAPKPAPQAVIVASHPLASEAGLEMMKRGGSAVDAAIAAQMVMTLVEPQSSGIGGGLFLLHHDAKTGRLVNYDGRETAPASVRPNLFIGPDGKTFGYVDAAVGGRSVGVPSVIATLWLAHKEHGKLPWADLFQPAIKLARDGFPVSARLAKVVGMIPSLSLIPETAAYFRPNGKPLVEGEILKNVALAETLQLIAEKGTDGFYKGKVAQAMVDAVTKAPRGAVALTLKDLQSYKPRKRDSLCGTYRGYKICGMRPPSSGGVTSLQILKLLERFDMGALAPKSARAIHLFADAQRLAFADRAAFMGDPDFVPVPVTGLLEGGYVKKRSLLINEATALAQANVLPGDPRGASRLYRRLRIPDHSKPSTAHVSIMDAKGNAVAMTTTVEGPFGSHLMAAGFMLNNQLTDFAFEPVGDNRRLANAPDAGKRPLSSMTPTLVFDARGRLYAVIGSPGGWRIIPYVTKTLLGLIDWKMDMAGAVGMPNVTSRSAVVELEKDTGLEAVAEELRAMGHEIKFADHTSGLNGFRIVPGGIDAAADPRREGLVLKN